MENPNLVQESKEAHCMVEMSSRGIHKCFRSYYNIIDFLESKNQKKPNRPEIKWTIQTSKCHSSFGRRETNAWLKNPKHKIVGPEQLSVSASYFKLHSQIKVAGLTSKYPLIQRWGILPTIIALNIKSNYIGQNESWSIRLI